jgi:YgiT-type zinc finger domain-containing protein
MSDKPAPICGEHQVEKEWRKTTFEYRDDGITVRVPNVYAWVCPENGEASFTPETVDELIATVRELIQVAKRAQQRRPVLTDYIVSVGR